MGQHVFMFALTDSQRLVGEAARNQCAMNPVNIVFDRKRLVEQVFGSNDSE
jgi:L1 cell adhesion molecule like protein